jgi:hypothetical protein
MSMKKRATERVAGKEERALKLRNELEDNDVETECKRVKCLDSGADVPIPNRSVFIQRTTVTFTWSLGLSGQVDPVGADPAPSTNDGAKQLAPSVVYRKAGLHRNPKRMRKSGAFDP